MFLSKIWFVLVGLLASLSLAAAFVVPRAADRRILELEGQRLDRAQYAAEQMLKADAHNWIDYAAKLSRDAILADDIRFIPTAGGSFMVYGHRSGDGAYGLYSEYRENNVGYADGHAETHRHTLSMTQSTPIPPDPAWDGEWIKFTVFEEYQVY